MSSAYGEAPGWTPERPSFSAGHLALAWLLSAVSLLVATLLVPGATVSSLGTAMAAAETAANAVAGTQAPCAGTTMNVEGAVGVPDAQGTGRIWLGLRAPHGRRLVFCHWAPEDMPLAVWIEPPVALDAIDEKPGREPALAHRSTLGHLAACRWRMFENSSMKLSNRTASRSMSCE